MVMGTAVKVSIQINKKDKVMMMALRSKVNYDLIKWKFPLLERNALVREEQTATPPPPPSSLHPRHGQMPGEFLLEVWGRVHICI